MSDPVVVAATTTVNAGAPAPWVLTPAVPAAPATPTSTTPPAAAGTPPPAAPAAPAPIPAAEPKPLEKTDLKIPEGKSMDAASLDTLLAFSKAQGLSKAQAQAILDRDLSSGEAQTVFYREEMKKQDGKWLDELKSHKEFGGVKFSESAEDAKRAFDYVDPDGSFRKDLEAAMLAHNPKLVMAFAKFGKLLKDDRLTTQSTSTPPKKSLEEMLYPSMVGKK